MEPNYIHAYNGLGNVLGDIASLKPATERLPWYEKAIDLYEQAIELDSNYVYTYANLGNTYFDIAKLKPETERLPWYEKAVTQLKHAETIEAGAGAYNLTCVYSLQSLFDDAKVWLMKCKEHNKLPSKTHMQQDTDLDNLRNLNWFKAFMDELEE